MIFSAEPFSACSHEHEMIVNKAIQTEFWKFRVVLLPLLISTFAALRKAGYFFLQYISLPHWCWTWPCDLFWPQEYLGEANSMPVLSQSLTTMQGFIIVQKSITAFLLLLNSI